MLLVMGAAAVATEAVVEVGVEAAGAVVVGTEGVAEERLRLKLG